MGVEITGYRKRTFAEILDAKIAKAKELFGDDIDTSEKSPLGKYIRINAYDQYHVEEIAETVYYSIFPQTASGTALDRLGWLAGVSRNPASYAAYTVKVTGKSGANIAVGFLVGTELGVNYYNTSNAVIDENGTAEITVQCVEPGEIGNVTPSDIKLIVNPVADIDAVEGVKRIENGEQRESDTDFRKKFDNARSGQGSTNEAAIKGALIKIPTVEDVIIDVDESNHNFTCYIKGGENYHQEIAEAIFDKKPIGISTDGTVSVPVSYGALTDYDVKFSHIAALAIYVKATIITDALYTADGDTLIKNGLESHINSIGCGENLVFTSLYAPIYNVAGVKSATIEISKDGVNWVKTDISVEPYESCSFEQLTLTKAVM